MNRSTWPADAGLALMVAVLFWASGILSSLVAVLLGALQIAPLVARRRAPRTVLVGVTVATVVHILAGLSLNIGYVPVLIGLYSASGWVCGASSLVIASAMSFVKGPVNGGLLAVVIAVVAWTLGVERRRHLADRARLASLEAAELRERTAMRLHDTLGQSTTVMLVQAEALKAVGTLAEAELRRVDAILAAGRTALTEVRRTLQDLRADWVEDVAVDLPAVVARLRDAGLVLASEPDLSHVPPLGARVIAEALTNVLRHAGPGVAAAVDVRVAAGSVDIRVRNRISGQAQPGAGFGLSSLESQVSGQGGRLDYGRRGRNWVVRAHFPAYVSRSDTVTKR